MNGTQGLACFVLMSIPLPLNLAPDCAKPVTMAPFSYPARDSLQGLLLGKGSSFGEGQTRKEQPHYHLEKRVPRTCIMHDKQFSKHRRAVSCFFSLDLPPTSHLPLFSCSDWAGSSLGLRTLIFLGFSFVRPVLGPLSSSLIYSLCRSIFFRGMGNIYIYIWIIDCLQINLFCTHTWFDSLASYRILGEIIISWSVWTLRKKVSTKKGS